MILHKTCPLIPSRDSNKDGTPSGAVRVVFISSQLPDSVKLSYSLHRVVPYVPPVRRCIKCQLLGHIKQDYRRRNPTCAKCEKEHSTQDCQSKSLFCLNCCGPHAASDYPCPEKSIRKLAHELKNTEYFPFEEALAIVGNRWEAKRRNTSSEGILQCAPKPLAKPPPPPPPKPVTQSPGKRGHNSRRRKHGIAH